MNRALALFLGCFAHPADAAPVQALAFSPDSTVLAVASGSTVNLHAADSGQVMVALSCDKERALALAFQSHGPFLAVGTGTPGEKGSVRLLDWRRRQWIASVATNNDVVTCVAFSPDGNTLVVASADHSVVLYMIEDNGARLVRKLDLAGHSGAVQAAGFSPDGQTLVTASVDRSLKVWSVTDGTLLRSLGQHTEAVLALAFRPVTPERAEAPPHCASGGDDRTVRVWQPAIGRMVRIVRGHDGPVLALVFAPDARSLFSAGKEGIVRRIDADSDELLGAWPASDDWIYALAISPDGKTLATGDWAGATRRWSVGEVEMTPLSDSGR